MLRIIIHVQYKFEFMKVMLYEDRSID